MSKAWQAQRAKKSAAFDADCCALATAFITFQHGQLRDAIRRYKEVLKRQVEADEQGGPRPFLVMDQKELNQMALSIRKMQEVGRMALGETTDRKQLDLNLDAPKDIQITVVHERPRSH